MIAANLVVSVAIGGKYKTSPLTPLQQVREENGL
jgi:hypothetical protein